MPQAYFLYTARLGFRCWSANDLPLAMALWGDPEVARWIGGPFSPDQVKSRLDREISTLADRGLQYWPIFLVAEDAFVGCSGLRPYKVDEGTYELGFHLCAAHWHKGLVEESARAAIAYAFDTMRANALFAGHHPANAASRPRAR